MNNGKCYAGCGRDATGLVIIDDSEYLLCDDCFELYKKGRSILSKYIQFTVPGEPIAKGRPRMARSGVVYTPKRTVSYENLIKEMYYSEHGGRELLEGALELVVKAYFKIPKSASKRKKEAMLMGEARPVKKPDTDNILKIIADALNNIAYDDDKQIVRAVVEKYYSDMPRLEVQLRRLES